MVCPQIRSHVLRLFWKNIWFSFPPFWQDLMTILFHNSSDLLVTIFAFCWGVFPKLLGSNRHTLTMHLWFFFFRKRALNRIIKALKPEPQRISLITWKLILEKPKYTEIQSHEQDKQNSSGVAGKGPFQAELGKAAAGRGSELCLPQPVNF